MTQPQPLNYANDRFFGVRRLGKRLFLLAWAAFTVYLAYDAWGERARLQVDLLRAQSACLSYAEAADRVVFEAEPARAAAIVQAGGYRGGRPRDSLVIAGSSSPAEFACWQRNVDQWGRFTSAESSIEEWRRNRHPPPKVSGGGRGLFASVPDVTVVVFMHRRRAAGGEERLLVIEAEWHAQYQELRFAPHVISPASWFGSVRNGPATNESTQAPVANDATIKSAATVPSLRVFAGQPDPVDASKFVIDYEVDGARGVIIGTLAPDDSVQLTLSAAPGNRGRVPGTARSSPPFAPPDAP